MSFRSRGLEAQSPLPLRSTSTIPERLQKVIAVGYEASAAKQLIPSVERRPPPPSPLGRQMSFFSIGCGYYGNTMDDQEMPDLAPPLPMYLSTDPFNHKNGKNNSGFREAWEKITKAGGYQPIDDPPVPDDKDFNAMCRKKVLAELKRQGLVHESASFTLTPIETDKNILASENSFLLPTNTPKDESLILVKMWGYAALIEMGNPFSLYERAVKELKKKMDGVNVEQIVLYFDGDASVEKDDKQPYFKMAHSIFAPYVANLLKTEFTCDKIHLLIVKKDAEKGRTALLEKFANEKEIWACGEPEIWKIRDVLHESEFGGKRVEKHTYPGVDSANFYSCTLAVLPKIEGKKPGESDPSGSSEHAISNWIETTFGGKISTRCCLCIGGNTEKSVEDIANKMGEKKMFDIVIRGRMINRTK
jgi:hypothetical protein